MALHCLLQSTAKVWLGWDNHGITLDYIKFRSEKIRLDRPTTKLQNDFLYYSGQACLGTTGNLLFMST